MRKLIILALLCSPAWSGCLQWSTARFLSQSLTYCSLSAPAGVTAYEPSLGNPDVDGKVLVSTAAGVRSWAAAGSYPGVTADGADGITVTGKVAASEIDLTAGTATQIGIKNGTCPATASAGEDYVVCWESGVAYKVDGAGVKTTLAPAATTRAGTGSPNGRDTCTAAGESYIQTDAATGAGIWYCVAGSGTTWQNVTPSPGDASATGYVFGQKAGVAWAITANGTNCSVIGVSVIRPVSFGNFAWLVATADNTATYAYDVGLYSGTAGGAGTLVAHTGSLPGTSFASTAATYTAPIAASGATCTAAPCVIQPGKYWIAWSVSNAGTGRPDGSTGGTLTFRPLVAVGSCAVGGILKQSITLPVDAWGTSTTAIGVYQ